MASSNRELSQFGSFIYIDDPTRKIAITTESTPFVGIGTTNPQQKLHVVGNVKVDGSLTFNGNLNLGNVDLNTTGIVTAAAFYNTSNQQLVAFDSWTTDDSGNIYILGNSVGIGTSTFSEALVVAANVSASRFISNVANGTPPFEVTSSTEITNLNASLLRGGIPGANINSFDIVTLGAVQNLSNKTLTLATIAGAGITFNGSSSGRVALRAAADAGTPLVILPSTNGTLVSTGDTGVITSNMLADLSITNADIAVGAGITYSKLFLVNSITNADIATGANIDVSKLSARTISGVTLGNNLNNLTSGSFINFSSGSTYNGSAAITVSVAATNTNTGNTIVSRNSSGDFTAGTISVSNVTASQTVQANSYSVNETTVFNSGRHLVNAVNGSFSGIVTSITFNATAADSYRIGGTTIFNSSRNLVNAANGSFSGILTSTAFNATNGSFSGIVTATQTIESNTLKISGQTVVDSSRNLSNINSLDSTVTSIWDTVGIGTTNKTLVNREYLSVVSSGSSITLPASPSPGWEVAVGVGTFSNVVILRNGSNIMSLAEDLTIDQQYVTVNLLYVDSTRGWRII